VEDNFHSLTHSLCNSFDDDISLFSVDLSQTGKREREMGEGHPDMCPVCPVACSAHGALWNSRDRELDSTPLNTELN
jgi:hypothetical protein